MTRHLLAIPFVLVLAACDSAPPSEVATGSVAAESKAPSKAEGGFDRPFGPVEIEASAAAKAAAEQMLARVTNDALAEDDRLKGDPAALAWVAATATDPDVVGDAVLALAITEQVPPPAAATVIAARLRCGDPEVLEGVSDALRDMMTQPALSTNETVVGAVVDAAQNHPNELVRGRAIASLWALSAERPEHALAVRTLDAASPPARLLASLEGMTPDRDDPLRAEIVERLTALSSHADPGVRGAAARRLGGADDGEPSRARLLAMLADESAFVRCQALEGLGYRRKSRKVLIGPVAAMLDDAGSCRQSVELPTIRGGTESSEIGSQIAVSLRAAHTLASLSVEADERLTIGPVPDGDASALATQVAAAKAWAGRQH